MPLDQPSAAPPPPNKRINTSFIGRSWPPTDVYLVGREKIREFATAIGATDALHHDPEAARTAGYADVVAPPTFPTVVTMKASRQIIDDPDLGLDYSRVVHGDQRFAFARPIVAGDTLVCVNTVEEILERGGHHFITTRTDVTTEAGEPVVTGWSKLVQRGAEQ
ncbi:MaoC family dehydratase N-terminal domain-containing protein [Actinoplanes sp. NPDC051470]|uniref:MaoC family dehydratase N-terminal domain-containing protein n=1 Tax=Actinoplanes sp. NPDC051470 TaxID=3157224 RepID=UPI00342F2EC1